MEGLLSPFCTRSDKSQTILCLILINERFDEIQVQFLLQYPVILYLCPACPYEQSSFLHLSERNIKPTISNVFSVENRSKFNMLLPPLDVTRVMKANRFVISPSHSSVSCLHRVVSSDEEERASIHLILETLLCLSKS